MSNTLSVPKYKAPYNYIPLIDNENDEIPCPKCGGVHTFGDWEHDQEDQEIIVVGSGYCEDCGNQWKL